MTETKPQFNKQNNLSEKELKQFEFVQKRITQLQDYRKKKHFGSDLERIWNDADKDYVPHRLGAVGKKVLVTDEDKGWRSSFQRLGTENWQSDLSNANPYVKISTAVTILVDQNPTGTFTATSKKYENTTLLMKQLYQRSWEIAKSRSQLKLFVHNLTKYGWAVARTFPLQKKVKVRKLIEFNEEEPDKSTYEEKEVIEYDDVMRKNLNPWNVWIDDMARPNTPDSVRDWSWREVYPMDLAEQEFGNRTNWKFVQPGGTTTDTLQGDNQNTGKEYEDENLLEVYFYENRMQDLFMVIANGVPVIIEPLAIQSAQGAKKLSLWQTYWTLRHAESPYGVGIYEAIRLDNAILERIDNMSIDQLMLSIYKMWFYQGTQALTDTGDIKITPGVGKQVLDPKNINWLEVPGPGAEALNWRQLKKTEIDETSGITDPLIGAILGKTAFETAQAKESALRRLKAPLDNVLEALNEDGYLTLDIIQLMYSVPEVFTVTDPELAQKYLTEVESDPDLWERNEEGAFIAKVFRELPLNLDSDEEGNLTETQETKFFRVKPKFLEWQGIISIKAQSILAASKQIEKSLNLELYNILIPLLGQPPEIYRKIAKALIKDYDKDPKDLLPDFWLNEEQQLFTPQPGLMPIQQEAQKPQAQQFVSAPQQPQQAKSLGGRVVSGLSNLFR